MTLDREPFLGGSNEKRILHALVLGMGTASRQDIIERLDIYRSEGVDRAAASLRSTLVEMRKKGRAGPPGEGEPLLDFSKGNDPIALTIDPTRVAIDLWELFEHVEAERWAEAHALVAHGEEPDLLDGARDDPVWAATLARFAECRRRVRTAMRSTSARAQSMRKQRELLLGRSLVPGVVGGVRVRDVRARLEPLVFPWREHGAGAPGATPLAERLADVLPAEEAAPSQAIVIGPPGAGKTLTAISTFLRLTDRLDDPAQPAGPTVLYVDGEREGAEEGFGDDAWFERRLRDADGLGHGRPIVVIAHADAFLASHQADLGAALGRRLFRDADVMVCCSVRLYQQLLRYAEFGTDVFELLPWDRGLQRAFAAAVFGAERASEFAAWVRGDAVREGLCDVPLNLVHVLWTLGEDPEILDDIATSFGLLEGVARMRLRVAHEQADEERLLLDLGALAHRFYVDARPVDGPLRFTVEELRRVLAERGRAERADVLEKKTLLTAQGANGDLLRLEDPSWVWFFVVRHLRHTLLVAPEETLRAFSTFFSADVMELCGETLRDALPHQAEETRRALRDALVADDAAGLEPGRLTVAREQVGYLLGTFDHDATRRELAALLDPASPAFERDEFVRRGIVFGLVDGGAAHVADGYVEALRAEERGRDGTAPQRDANIGFALSFRGDQPFDPDAPSAIQPGVEPMRTVAGFVRGLGDEEHRGSWRIKLYTLVDLASHPAIGPARFACAIAPHRDELRDVLAGLRADPASSAWPELAELDDLLVATV